MLAAVLTLLSAQAAPTLYLPDANLELNLPLTLTPVIDDAETKTSNLGTYGGDFQRSWTVDQGFLSCTIRYIHFTPATPAKLTAEKLATHFHDGSKELAESMQEFIPDMVETFKQKFSNRNVTTKTLSPKITATIDSHEDLVTNTVRHHIAWQAPDHQVILELSADANDPDLVKAANLIIDSIKLKTLTPAEWKDRPLVRQILPTLGLTVSAPAPFSSLGESASGTSYILSSFSGFTVQFIPSKNLKIDQTIDLFKSTYKSEDYEVKATKTEPIAIGDYKGQILKTDYLEFGHRQYALQLVLSNPNQDLIIHIIISNECGGKAKADEILGSLKPR